jgi:hypothetical protein
LSLFDLILDTIRILWRVAKQLFCSVELRDQNLNTLGPSSAFELDEDEQLIQDLDYLNLNQLIGVLKLLIVNLGVRLLGIGLGPDDNWQRELEVKSRPPVPVPESMSGNTLHDSPVEGDAIAKDTGKSPAAVVENESQPNRRVCCGLTIDELFDFKINPYVWIICAVYHFSVFAFTCYDVLATFTNSTSWHRYQLITFRSGSDTLLHCELSII